MSNSAASAVLLAKSRNPTPPQRGEICRLPVGPLFALVSPDDFERARFATWRPDCRPHTTYAKANAWLIEGGRRIKTTIHLHRYLMNAAAGVDVDHGDGDGLNCLRYNLEEVTRRENIDRQTRRSTSTTGFQGVHTHHNKFRVYVSVPSRVRGRRFVTIYVGLFEDKVEAALAHDRMARELLGARARLNFPEVRA